jgi:probable phosphoglycerate mutase
MRVSNPGVELTEKGRNQARDAARALKDKGIDTILVSPLIRARQTAEIIASELSISDKNIHKLEILTERQLGEYDDQPRPANKNYFYEIDEGVGVEKLSDVTKRAEQALKEVMEFSESSTILIVGHGILGYFMRQIVAGRNPYEKFDWGQKIKNCEIVEMKTSD